MPNLRSRKIISVGDSLAVTLPPEWLRGNRLSPGDELVLRYNGKLFITPKRRSDGNRDASSGSG